MASSQVQVLLINIIGLVLSGGFTAGLRPMFGKLFSIFLLFTLSQSRDLLTRQGGRLHKA